MWTNQKPNEEGWYLIRIYNDELEKYIIREVRVLNDNGLIFELDGAIHCLEDINEDIEWENK